ncbi:MAG: ABC transporter ATP-binding protein [Acidobacteriota bacterium]
MTSASPVKVSHLAHAYGQRTVLHDLDFEIQTGERFGLLGPNGSGKTTLFKILATLLTPSSGKAEVFGFDVGRSAAQVRARLGIIFQSPALDAQLTVEENLRHHAHLHGLKGARLTGRLERILSRLDLVARRRDRVGTLSGGLARRCDLARGLLHAPGLLLLDEPTAGLDPVARREFWQELERQQAESGLTLLLTTHLMAEAERCNRLGILDRGRLVALETPARLCAEVGGTVVTIKSAEAETLAPEIQRQFQMATRIVDGCIRMEHPQGHDLVPRLAGAFPGRISSVTVQTPTLEDAFIHRTGHQFGQDDGGREKSA